jgi:drug/metabolite transporter (DMT)-like permease
MPVLTKVVYRDGADPTAVLAVRFTVAGVLLLGLAVVRRDRLPRRSQLLALLLLGAMGYALQSFCYFNALTHASAGLVALLLYTYPALVVVLSAVLSRAMPPRATAVALLVALVGTALTIGPVAGGETAGVLLGLGAALTYSVYIVVSNRWIVGLGPLAVSAVIMSAAAVVYDAAAVVTRPTMPTSVSAWAALLAVATVCTVLSVSTFFAGLRRLGPSQTSIVSTLEPVVSVALGAAALGESLGALQLVGGALVIAAVVALARAGDAPAGEPT